MTKFKKMFSEKKGKPS